MAKTGFQLDIAGFEKQINQVKLKIANGVNNAFNDSTLQDYLKNIMHFYIQETVYDVYTPKVYQRTYDLLNSVTAKVIGDTLYIYVNDQGMDKPNGQWSYPHRVILGDDYYSYDFPKEGAAFMNPRDWRYVTKEELVNHTNQSGIVLNIIKNIIQKSL